MSVVEWDNDRELMFLECYQAEPVLWDSKHAGHRIKTKVHDAWIRISAVMNIPVADLKKKKDSLMSSYRTYRKKVKDSIHSGAGSDEIYKPIWFAYEFMDSFLGEGLACKKKINTEEPANNEETNNNEEENEEAQEADTSHNVDNQQTVRRRKNPSELVDAGEAVKDCLSTLKKTLSTRREDDECDLHGKIIAKKLRLLSEHERDQIICEIYQMFQRRKEPQFPGYFSPARSETPGYFSPARTYISSPSPSPQQQQRGTCSRRTYSKPPMMPQQRAISSRSTYSEPPMIQQQRATSSRSTYSEPPNYSVYSDTPINQHTYLESPPFEAPVIHIPQETSAATNSSSSSVYILSDGLIQPATDRNDTSDQPTEGPTGYENLIDKAFKFA